MDVNNTIDLRVEHVEPFHPEAQVHIFGPVQLPPLAQLGVQEAEAARHQRKWMG